MSKSETTKFIAMMMGYYPRWEPKSIDLMEGVWFDMFKDIPFNLMCIVLKKLAMESKFAPSVKEVLDEIDKMAFPEEHELSADDAWKLVLNSMSKYGRYNIQKAMESFPENVRAAVETVGYNTICNIDYDKLSIIRSQFSKAYDVIGVRKKERRLMSPILDDELKKIIDNFDMKNIFNRKENNKVTSINERKKSSTVATLLTQVK